MAFLTIGRPSQQQVVVATCWKLFAVLASVAERLLGEFNVQYGASTSWALALVNYSNVQLCAVLALCGQEVAVRVRCADWCQHVMDFCISNLQQ